MSTLSNIRNQYVPATGETVYNRRKRAQIRRRHNTRGSLGDGDLRHQPSTLDYTLGYLQCWYADDASGSGSLEAIKQWWDELTEAGPNLGYYPDAKKCWLITKPEKVEGARAIFEGTAINISTQGQSHLGAALGSREYLEEYVGSKVEDWVSQVIKLAEFAMSQPQACYAAFTFGLRHRWIYLLRTLPDIEDLVEPLERAIADVLIPSITDHHCTTPSERDLLALPVRLGGLGIINPSQDADLQYQASMKTTAPLVEKIVSQVHEKHQTIPLLAHYSRVCEERKTRCFEQDYTKSRTL